MTEPRAALVPVPATMSWKYKSPEIFVIFEMSTPSDAAYVSVAGSDGGPHSVAWLQPDARITIEAIAATPRRKSREIISPLVRVRPGRITRRARATSSPLADSDVRPDLLRRFPLSRI